MEEYKQAEVISNERISYNIIHLIISNPFIKADFIVSSFLLVESPNLTKSSTNTNEEIIRRPYTPVNITDKTIEFIIKIYEKGKLTKYLENRKAGDVFKISKPIKKLEYIQNKLSDVYMIAGGTGITPMYQILQYVAESANENKTNFVLFFCNKNIKDIFLERELKNVQNILKNKLKIIHIVNSEEHNIINTNLTNYERGHINRNILEKYSINELKEKQNILIYVCGPPGFMDAVSGDKTIDKQQGEVKGILNELGFLKNQVYKF